MTIRSQKQGLVKGSSLVAAAVVLLLVFFTVAHSQSQGEPSSESLIAANTYGGAETATNQTPGNRPTAIAENADSAVLPAAADELAAVEPPAPANTGRPDLSELLMAAAVDGPVAMPAGSTQEAQNDMAEFLAQKASMLENMIKLIQIKEELLASRIAFDQELARMEIKTRGQR